MICFILARPPRRRVTPPPPMAPPPARSPASGPRRRALLFPLLLLPLLLLLLHQASSPSPRPLPAPRKPSQACDYSAGEWVRDASAGPAIRYDHTCKEIFKGWNCIANAKANGRDLLGGGGGPLGPGATCPGSTRAGSWSATGTPILVSSRSRFGTSEKCLRIEMRLAGDKVVSPVILEAIDLGAKGCRLCRLLRRCIVLAA